MNKFSNVPLCEIFITTKATINFIKEATIESFD